MGLLCTGVPAQAPPDTDVFVLSVRWMGDRALVGEPENMTAREGYDNQPRFRVDGSILYTRLEGEQADVYRIPPDGGEHENLTRTAESEYSPTPRPDGSFTVVRVEADGKQRLWRFAPGGAAPELLFPALEPVGYHAWADEGRAIVAFVLGEPHRLVIARPVADEEPRTVATDIGRALVPLDERRVAFVQKGETWTIDVVDAGTGEITTLTKTRPEREDFAADPRGGLWMGDGSRLFRLPPGGSEWREVADLSAAGIADISRLDVSTDGAKLVLVARPKGG
jgi:hypothetical protein